MTGGFPVFNSIKKIETKQHGSWLFTSFNECSSRLGSFVCLPDFKGLAVKSADVITYSYKPWSRHLSRMVFLPNYAQYKGHIYSCACIYIANYSFSVFTSPELESIFRYTVSKAVCLNGAWWRDI